MPIHFQLAMERTGAPSSLSARGKSLHRSDRGGQASARASAALEAISNHAPLKRSTRRKAERFAPMQGEEIE